MKPSVMLFPFHAALIDGSLDPDTLIASLKSHGALAVETMHGLERSHPETFDRLLAAIRRHGLDIACHDIGINLLADHATRPQQLALVRRQLEFAAQTLRCHTVLLYNNVPCPDHDKTLAQRLYGDALAVLDDTARKLNITLTIEDYDPTRDFACASPDLLAILGAARGHARLTFDTGNFLTAHEEPHHAFDALRHLIAHVHIKDMRRPQTRDDKATICIIGQGHADIPRLLQLLRQHRYDGFLSIEIGSHALQDALDALDFIRRH